MMTKGWRFILVGAGLAVCQVVAGAAAQFTRPKAEVTPHVLTETIHAGGSAQLSLEVRLPAEIHVQSNKPRDESLIPTSLTIEAPAGMKVASITYPPATDLTQAGQAEPLAVFDREFTIKVTATLDTSVAPGDLVVPARLRYQACDAHMCYPPARADVRWTLVVTKTGA